MATKTKFQTKATRAKKPRAKKPRTGTGQRGGNAWRNYVGSNAPIPW